MKTSKTIDAAIKARPGVVGNYSWDIFDKFWECLLIGHRYDNPGQHIYYERKAADLARIIRRAVPCNCDECSRKSAH